MMCSASSFGCSASSASEVLVLGRGGPAPARPGDGPRRDDAVAQPHHGLGRRSHHRALVAAQEVEVRARVDQAQDPVEVEGVGVEVEIETLGQHHLEDVAGGDVLLGHGHGVSCTWPGPSSGPASGPRRPDRGAPGGACRGVGTGRRPVAPAARWRRRRRRRRRRRSSRRPPRRCPPEPPAGASGRRRTAGRSPSTRASGSRGRRGGRRAGARPRARRRSRDSRRARRAAGAGRRAPATGRRRAAPPWWPAPRHRCARPRSGPGRGDPTTSPCRSAATRVARGRRPTNE